MSISVNNPISDIRLQIYDPEENTYQIIFSSKEKNVITDIYQHRLKTGIYDCILNINTQKNDEYVKLKISLVNNKKYRYKCV